MWLRPATPYHVLMVAIVHRTWYCRIRTRFFFAVRWQQTVQQHTRSQLRAKEQHAYHAPGSEIERAIIWQTTHTVHLLTI